MYLGGHFDYSMHKAFPDRYPQYNPDNACFVDDVDAVSGLSGRQFGGTGSTQCKPLFYQHVQDEQL